MERRMGGRVTVRPKAGTDEMVEARLQTVNGQRKALGQEMMSLPEPVRMRLQAKFEGQQSSSRL